MYIHIYVYIFSKQHELSYNFFNLISLLLYLYLKKNSFISLQQGVDEGMVLAESKITFSLGIRSSQSGAILFSSDAGRLFQGNKTPTAFTLHIII